MNHLLTDPTVRIVVVGALYAVCVCTCAMSAGLCRGLGRPSQTWFWAAVATVVLIIGLVRALHLDLWLTELLRTGAKDNGWYTARRPVQAFALGVTAALLAATGVRVLWLRFSRRVTLASLGVLGLLGVLLTNLVSLHLVDEWLSRDLGPLTLRNAVEFASLVGLIAAAAGEARELRQEQRIQGQINELATHLALINRARSEQRIRRG